MDSTLSTEARLASKPAADFELEHDKERQLLNNNLFRANYRIDRCGETDSKVLLKPEAKGQCCEFSALGRPKVGKRQSSTVV